MISYGDFIKAIRQELWPRPVAGEAASLVSAHNASFKRAMIDLQKWVPCLQQNHTDVHPACSTYVQCGITLFEAPPGVVSRIYTIVNGDWCTKVPYESGAMASIQCWSANLRQRFTSPANVGLPGLDSGAGARYAEASTDKACGRARCGLWVIHRRRLNIVPWIQSNEDLVVEWDGVKHDWAAGDMLDNDNVWTPDVAAAVKAYVAWEHERDYWSENDPQAIEYKKLTYENARADLMYWCRERTRQQEAKECCQRGLTRDELAAEAVPVASSGQVFAVIGDFGMSNNPGEIPMAAMVKGWNPSYIVTVGDNWQDTDPTQDNLGRLDSLVGQYFADYLFPYIGTYSSAATEQRMFAALGNHDRDGTAARLNLVLQYFNMPALYYDVVQGPIHWFIMDSGYDNSLVNQEPDGIQEDQAQAAWLKAKLATSTARFKIVIFHHPPISSTLAHVVSPEYDGSGMISFPKLMWHVGAWGADLVLGGHDHNYERLLPTWDTCPHIICGTGGGDLADFHVPPRGDSVTRFKGFGAMRGTVDCNTLKLEWFSNDQQATPFDTVTITKT